MTKVGVHALGLAFTLSLGAIVLGCGDYAPTQPMRIAASGPSVGRSQKTLVPYFLDRDTSSVSLSVANAINIVGTVVGYYRLSGVDHRPAVWTRRGGLRDLGTIPGATSTDAVAINSEGEIVGVATVSGSGNHGVLWRRHGPPIDLGTSFLSDDINDCGQIAGQIGNHAVIWTRRGWPGTVASTSP